MSGAIVSGKTDRKNGKHMKVGDKIKRIRQFRGMTQAELGRKLDMGDTSQARIGQYEIGFRTPSKELLDKMAKALDVSPNAL
jgi:transcriptional regulator with XRE-family HTH domain